MDQKIKDALLNEFKKANKSRKEKLAKKYGYNTTAEYLAYLTNMEMVAKPVKKEKTTVHNVMILDASGSMTGDKLDSALEGINAELGLLKDNNDVSFTHTIVDFSGQHQIHTPHLMQTVEQIGKFKTHCKGSTALYQAVGTTIEKMRKSRKYNDKVLIKIFTDGEENDSKEEWKDGSKLKSLIAEVEKEGFTITFIGTKFDIDTVVKRIGIHYSNTLAHNNTAKDIKTKSAMRAGASVAYASKVAAGEEVSLGFFSKTSGTLED